MNQFQRRLLLILLLLLPLAGIAAAGNGKGPAPAATDKCPVCGMFVAKFPNWVAASRFRDGTTVFFDGPKDLFAHYFDCQRYTPGRKQADIVSLTVKEYYSLRPIDARSAVYVIGSNIYGPMGKELIPFATEQDAAAFMQDHQGKRLLRFREITPALIRSLQ